MFHINNDGEVKPCSAEKEACRFSSNPHFENEQEAWDAQDQMYSDFSVATPHRKTAVSVDDALNTPLEDIDDGVVYDRDTGRKYSTDLVIVPISGVDELRRLSKSPAEAQRLSKSDRAKKLIVNAEGKQPTDELYSDEYVIIERRSGFVLSPNVSVVDQPEHPADKMDFYHDDDFAMDYTDTWGASLSIAD